MVVVSARCALCGKRFKVKVPVRGMIHARLCRVCEAKGLYV